MRITYKDFDDLFSSLEYSVGRGATVFENALRYDIDRREISEGVLFVTIKAFALIELPDTSQYLAESFEECGKDYADSDPSNEGMEAALARKQDLQAFAEKNGFTLLPGEINL